MPASKTLFALLPAVLAVPLVAPAQVKAQEKIADSSATQPMPRAELTALARPATTIAPHQSLPTFVAVKATLSPVLATPTNTGKAIAAPVLVEAAPMKAAALPAPTQKLAVSGSLSARASVIAGAPAPVAAIPPVMRGRRAYAAAVSLSTSPQKPISPISAAVTAPVVSAPVSVKAIAPLPAIDTKTTSAATPVVRPSALASREAKAREIALARLDAQLAGAEGRLNRAQSKLTEGQRQLGSVSNLLQNAMLSSGGSGLHPFVRVAQRYLGTPYVWGGESARGFDCSGFIMRVMRDLGYKALPHSAAEQFNYGKPVSKELLQPGDIVFFANTYKPGVSHVGIYLGGGRFIHAANSQVGTIVSNLNSAKWVAHYAGARRLMKMN